MKERKICCICGKEFIEFGNNPEPVKPQEVNGKLRYCCNDCDVRYVIPARFKAAKELSE